MQAYFLLLAVGLALAQNQNFQQDPRFNNGRPRGPSNFFRAPQPRPQGSRPLRQQDSTFQRQNQAFIREQQAIIERQRAQQRRQNPAAFQTFNQQSRQPQPTFFQPQQPQQFRPQQQQQFRAQARPQQSFNQRFGQQAQAPRPTFLNNNRAPQPTFLNNQFKPQTGGQNQIQSSSGKAKKPEVDPSTLNPPTETNPSPTNDQGRRFVAQPQPEKCRTRTINARHGNHGYYATWLDQNDRNKEYDWLDARNYCRQRCMDSVSIESEAENSFVQDLFMQGYRQGIVAHVWTSGRVCDFDGCDRPDLQPIRVNGWFWPATNGKVALNNNTAQYAGWSRVGGFPGQGQPDNRQGKENCIALLNPDVYKEPDNLPHWHDVKCEYRKKMLCEDNDNLLGFVRQENPGLSIP